MLEPLNAPGSAPKEGSNGRHANLSGQAMGTKGLATRRRLIAAMIVLLERTPLRDLTVKAIASEAGMSPATFYIYFRSVRECLYAATRTISQSTPAILEVLGRDWNAASSIQNSWEFVMDHLELWEQHRSLLRARDLAAEEGDPDFLLQRRLSLETCGMTLARQAERQQQAGRLDPALSPLALSAALISMLDLVSALFPVTESKRATVERNQVHAAAFVVAAALGCPGVVG
jgi:AcrR family transcriptional regulator